MPSVTWSSAPWPRDLPEQLLTSWRATTRRGRRTNPPRCRRRAASQQPPRESASETSAALPAERDDRERSRHEAVGRLPTSRTLPVPPPVLEPPHSSWHAVSLAAGRSRQQTDSGPKPNR